MLTTSHGWGISARAHVHTALLYLRNGLTDCVQIWYVGCASLSICFPQVRGGWGISARAHVNPHLRVSGSEWPIVLNLVRGWRPNSYERWDDWTFARASPVPLSRKPLSPDIEATPKTNLPISFTLARSSPNMASYWYC